MTQILRDQVPEEEIWNLKDIFSTDNEWEQSYMDIELIVDEMIEQPLSVDNAKDLYESINSYDSLLERVNQISNYAFYKYSEDSTDSSNQIRLGRSQTLLGKVKKVKIRFVSALVGTPAAVINQFMNEQNELASFERFFQRIEETRKHALVPNEEELLAALDQTLKSMEAIYLTSAAADLTFSAVENKDGEKFPVSLHMYMTQVETSPDTVLRRNAYQSLTEGLSNYQHGYAQILATEINKNVTLAKVRGFPSVLDMHLQYSSPANEYYATDGISTAFFEEILDTFRQELSPHMRRYAKLRKKQLGLEYLLFSDVKAPIDPSFDPKITYEEAGKIIIDAVGVLGTEYQVQMKRVFDEKWVYRGNNVGRRMIAFGGGVHGVHGYSFYPWGGSLFDLLLLGHELGHTIHYTLSAQNQRIINNSQSLLFVEAPSTMVEHLIVQYLRGHQKDERLKRWLNMYLMMSYHHNCVTHILEAEFLRRLYKLAEAKEPLTTTVMNETKGEILSEFWGDTIVIDDSAKLTWMRQPHYYMGLYPFTYSVGMSASTVIAERMKTEGLNLGKKWTDVLKHGGSRNGFELYNMAGIDMSNTTNLKKAISIVGSIVDELENSF